MNKLKLSRKRRILRVRKKLKGTKDRPRLSVHRSNKNLYAQFIDDDNCISLGGGGTIKEKKQKKEAAKVLGKNILDIAKNLGITKVVFDRGRFKYHGIIKVFAETLREGGLEF